MKETLSQEALVHVGVWCLGEFGDHLVSGRAVGPDNQPIHVSAADVLDLLQDAIRKPPNPDKGFQTHALIAAALIKLVTRCPSEFDRIRKCLRRFECSLHADLQQRSCEFLELLEAEWDSSRAGILDRMPVSEREVGGADNRPAGDASIDEVPSASNGGPAPIGVAAAPAQGGAADLLDLNDLLDDGPKPAAQPAAPAPQAGGNLLDLLDMGGGAAPVAPAPVAAAPGGADLGLLDIFGGGAALAPAAAPPATLTLDVFEKAGLKIQMTLNRDPMLPGSSSVLARFGNMSSMPMNTFVFEAAVPKYLQLKMEPATGQVLMPQSSNVTQSMVVCNTTNGEKPLLMKLRISYEHNGAIVQEQAQVANFPAGY
jgi:AP-1 complex subunit gamma-1